MADWYPEANKSALGNDSGAFVPGYSKRGVLHTTEGSTASGAISAYRRANSWPHFTVEKTGVVYQHLSILRAARALQNLAGGVETNRMGAIQIEVVGYASQPAWPEPQNQAMRRLMRWIEAETGIKPVGVVFGGSNQYGYRNPFELTNNQWIDFNGWCGHQHVPENSHWDPGAINITALLPPPTPVPVPTPGFTVPVKYYTEVPQVPFPVSRPQGGWIVVGGDGGVFAYGTPFYGSLGGVALSSPIIDAAWSPSGAGYWLMGADGAIFAFGDAPYKGGWNGFPASVKGNRKPIGIAPQGAGYLVITLDPSNDGSPFDAYGFGL